MQNTEYPAKVIIAGERPSRETRAIREWLMENGYPELGIFRACLTQSG
ncbi:MAG: hypothetical protein IPP69_14865 [Flavobacteriales bacterium]|nr:hypothetical protein [Flavobacteriales bacterium]